MILTEREVSKLHQELNLHKLEKKNQLEELQRKISDVQDVKREFAAKSEFLYE